MDDVTQVAGVVLQDENGRYLLVQEKIEKAYGLWNLPAGHVDPGETPKQAAVREAKEEVGLDVETGALVYDFTSRSGKHFYAYNGTIVGGTMQANTNDILAAKWLSYAEILELDKAGKIRDPGIMQTLTISNDSKSFA